MKTSAINPFRRQSALSPEQSNTLLLLLSSVMVLAPYSAHLPLWISFSSTLILLWRATMTLCGAGRPPRWLLLLCALVALSGVGLSFGTLFGRDAGVAMLTLLLSFKVLEMQARRDLLSVILLSFFLLLCNFFYSQSILTALLMMATVIILLTAQLSFQCTGVLPPIRYRLRLGASMFAIAAPLGAVLFVIVPRVQGPLWGLAQDSQQGRSGLSDSMAPGAMTALALSQDTVFRVHFAGQAPDQSALYWRAYVLGDFDGRNWSRIPPPARETAAPAVKLSFTGTPIHYQVSMEASGQRILPALEMLLQAPRINGVNAGASRELEWFAAQENKQRLRYDAVSYLNFKLQADDSVAHLEQWQNLPAGFNPRTLAFALEMQRQDPAASINAVLAWFRKNHFKYTLQAPLLGKNAVDDFLFISRAGFCEHYASAFVVIMRAMDIPARIVTGYQGGAVDNSIDNSIDSSIDPAAADAPDSHHASLTVRQADAHAWAEVWLAGRGWLRIDPTAEVAPERLAHRLARPLPAALPFGLQGLAYLIDTQAGNHWSQLAGKLDVLNNVWRQWILDYNRQRQQRLLQTIAGKVALWPLALTRIGARSVLGLCSMLLLIVGLLLLSKKFKVRFWRNAPDPLDALYRTFCRQQGRQGCTRAPDEGPLRYAQRLVLMARTQHQHAAIQRFLRLYGRLKYGTIRSDHKSVLLKILKRLLTQTR